MHVLIAPDSFGGTLSAPVAASAIAEGWAASRPGDDLALLPLSDGGEGLLDVALAAAGRDAGAAGRRVDPGEGGGSPGPAWRRIETEVVGPLGLPVEAAFLLDGATALVESAAACGLALVPADHRDPLRTTTWGVGQLLEAARAAGAAELLVGLGGSATADGGMGALAALGFRPQTGDGSGLKIGGGELERLERVSPAWVDGGWEHVRVRALADVTTTLFEAPGEFGPQKGADSAAVARLESGLRRWDEVARRDLVVGDLAVRPMTGAAGGLGYGLAAGLGAALEPGGRAVAELVRLDEALASAAVVVTGEGALDRSSLRGKVVGTVATAARRVGVPVVAVVGRGDTPKLDDVERSAPDGPGEDPSGEVAAAARRLAARWRPPTVTPVAGSTR